MKQHYSNELAQSIAPFSRRSFLKGSVLLGVGTTMALTLGCATETQQQHVFLSNDDAEVLAKLIKIMFPEDAALHSVNDIPMMQNIDSLMGFVDEDLRNDLSAGTKLFNYGAIVMGLHLTTFTNLDVRDAERYVNDWQSGGEIQRGLLSGLKKLIYTAYWRDPKTWAAVDFDGPVSDKWGLESLGNTPMPTA